MMKKILVIILSALMLTACVLIFSACEMINGDTPQTTEPPKTQTVNGDTPQTTEPPKTQTEHTHTYSWAKNDTAHWQECSCGDKKDINAHSFDQVKQTKEPDYGVEGEKICTCICGATAVEKIAALAINTEQRGYTVKNETDIYFIWDAAEKEAFGMAESGEVGLKASHIGDEIFFDDKGHIIFSFFDQDKTSCYFNVGEDGKLSFFGNAEKTVKLDKVSGKCYGYEYQLTEGNTKLNITITVPGTEKSKFVLVLTAGEPKPHEHELVWKNNETTHWQECYCGEKSNIGDHSFNTLNKCACGAVKPGPVNHVGNTYITYPDKVTFMGVKDVEEMGDLELIRHYYASFSFEFVSENLVKVAGFPIMYELLGNGNIYILKDNDHKAEYAGTFNSDRTEITVQLEIDSDDNEWVVIVYSLLTGDEPGREFQVGKTYAPVASSAKVVWKSDEAKKKELDGDTEEEFIKDFLRRAYISFLSEKVLMTYGPVYYAIIDNGRILIQDKEMSNALTLIFNADRTEINGTVNHSNYTFTVKFVYDPTLPLMVAT